MFQKKMKQLYSPSTCDSAGAFCKKLGGNDEKLKGRTVYSPAYSSRALLLHSTTIFGLESLMLTWLPLITSSFKFVAKLLHTVMVKMVLRKSVCV